VLPAPGYGAQQLKELKSSTNNAIADRDVIVLGTPACEENAYCKAGDKGQVRGSRFWRTQVFAASRQDLFRDQSKCAMAFSGSAVQILCNEFIIINTLQASITSMALNPSIRVKAAMSKDIVSVEAERSVRSAIKTMVKNDLGAVVITENGKPAGIVTERDVMKSIGYGKVRLDTKIGRIMSKPLIAIDSDATLGEAADLMVKRKIRRLLVKEDSKYVGIITQRDLQRLMTDTFKSLLLI